MSSQVMCFCKTCRRNTVGIRTGMSAGGHVFGLLLTFLTGLLGAPLYILMVLCSGETRCTCCGKLAKKL